MQKGYYIMGLIALVLIGGAFYGGYTYGTSKASATTAAGLAAFRNGAGRTGRFGGGAGGASATASAIRGSILSNSAGTLTIQLDNNAGSTIVLYSPSTTITKTTNVDSTGLQTGQTVMIRGTKNTDGSVTAQSIQLVPAGVPTSTTQG